MEDLYSEAKPVEITLREAQELEKHLENEAYSLTYISKEKQDAIIRSHTKILNSHYTQQVKRSVLMGAAPSNNLEQVQEQREKAGLPPIKEEETQEQQEESDEEQELLEEIVEELENRNSAYYMDELTPKEIVEEVLNSAAQVIDLSEEDKPEEIKGEQQSE